MQLLKCCGRHFPDFLQWLNDLHLSLLDVIPRPLCLDFVVCKVRCQIRNVQLQLEVGLYASWMAGGGVQRATCRFFAACD